MWKSNYYEYENDISYIIVFIVIYTAYHQSTEIISKLKAQGILYITSYLCTSLCLL